MEGMNKASLIQTVAKGTGLSRNEVAAATNALIDVISGALIRGERVTITGFGTFDISHRQARAGVNPRTGKRIEIAAMKLPRFRAGKSLRVRVK